MNNRYLRMLIFFDLPTETTEDRREYARFHKFLVKNGFMMMQESVYCKIVLNATVQGAVMAHIRKNKPKNGLVQILTITEKQFSRMEYLVGEYDGNIINSDERLIIL